jgi:phytanoyl-CoA hydroxylase
VSSDGLSKAQIAAFRAHGFLNAGPLLDNTELEELRSEIDRLIRASFMRRSPSGEVPYAVDLATTSEHTIYQMVNLWEVSAPFRRLIAHPRIVAAAAALAGTADLQLWFDQAQCKPPRYGGAAEWHQDAMYWQQLEPDVALTAWVALDDADVENGCMWMVPGSHRWGRQDAQLLTQRNRREAASFGELPPFEPPLGEGSWAPPRACPVRAGEVHFHHCLTWHGSPMSQSERPRRAVAIHYLPGGVRYSGYASAHPLAARIRIASGTPMLADPENFPVVLLEGRHQPWPG